MNTTGFHYLATPYSRFPGGPEGAAILAAEYAAEFIKAGIIVYSPIVHSHEIAWAGEMDKLDHDFWLALDQPFMDAATGLIVVQMEGWQESVGIKREIEEFTRSGKPIYYWSATQPVTRDFVK